MALEIVEKESHGVTVLALAGRVTLGEETNRLRSKIREALDKGKDSPGAGPGRRELH